MEYGRVITIGGKSTPEQEKAFAEKMSAMLGKPELSVGLFTDDVKRWLNDNPNATLDETLCEFTGRTIALIEGVPVEHKQEDVDYIFNQQVAIIKEIFQSK